MTIELISPTVEVATLSTGNRWGTTAIENEIFVAKYAVTPYSIDVYDAKTYTLKRTITTYGISPTVYGSLGTDGKNLFVGNSEHKIVSINKDTGATISVRTSPTYDFKWTGTFHIDLIKDIIVYMEYTTSTNNVIIKQYSTGITLQTYSMPTAGSGGGATIYGGKHIIATQYASRQILVSSDISNGYNGLTFKILETPIAYMGGLATYENKVIFAGYDKPKLYSLEVTPLKTEKHKLLLSSGDGKVRSIEKGGYTDNLIPVMTTNTSPSGAASASSIYNANYPAQQAFNGMYGEGTGQQWMSSIKTGWIDYKFEKAQKVEKYSIVSSNIATESPRDWTFEGSNDGVMYTILDTQKNHSWIAFEEKSFEIKNNHYYSHYRVNITLNNGHALYCGLGELKMFGLERAIRTTLSQSEQTFINHGMSQSDLASVDMYANFTEKHYIQDVSTVLSSGKVFEQVLDVNKVLKKMLIK